MQYSVNVYAVQSYSYIPKTGSSSVGVTAEYEIKHGSLILTGKRHYFLFLYVLTSSAPTCRLTVKGVMRPERKTGRLIPHSAKCVQVHFHPPTRLAKHRDSSIFGSSTKWLKESWFFTLSYWKHTDQKDLHVCTKHSDFILFSLETNNVQLSTLKSLALLARVQ